MANAPPSRNTAMDGTMIGLVELMQKKIAQNTDDMLPAKVIAYDRATNRAQVQPLIVMVNTLNEQIPRAQIASLPVLQIGAGGFVMSFPVITGDIGWIKANDRDISLFLKNYNQSPPNTQRKHNFADAVFIPDSFMRDVVIAEEDAENLVIQTIDSSVRVAIWADKVKVTAPAVILDTPLTTCTGDLQVDGNTTVTGTTDLTGNVTAHNDLTVNNDIMVDNDITVVGDADIGGIPYITHVHGGVQTGGGNTGVPS